MASYVGNEALGGNLPFPHARDKELIYILRKLLELRLYPGSLLAALSEKLTPHAVDQPPLAASLAPKDLLADAVRRSSVAHLFHFYSVLCAIASVPRRTPATWVALQSEAGAKEMDAQTAARERLNVLGKEMGVRGTEFF
uniref:Uncharacterized protein n=1 Tax=Mycena chlorophos TaxID=658473 RepID=A0ABQ0LZD0_MYCCL|nr:predicted protein [Mycena chlorophos]